MTTDTHKKPASGDVGREAFELYAYSQGWIRTRGYDGEYSFPFVENRWKDWKACWSAAIRHRGELDTNRKCECTFLCKFCREKRDELEKGHE